MPRPSRSGAAATVSRQLRLYRWYDPAILVTAALAGSAGFAQFSVTSALTDVARSFGQPSSSGSSVAAHVGLSFTVLGVGLAVIRLAALGRPLLAGTNAVSRVIAAEETRSSDRTKAIALVTAGWGAETGAIAVVRGLAGDALSWRGLLALLVVPLVLVPLFGRWLEEPDRFERSRAGSRPRAGGAVP